MACRTPIFTWCHSSAFRISSEVEPARSGLFSFKVPVPQHVQDPEAAKVYIKIDSLTAHPRLCCWGTALSLADQNQNVPDLPGRFNQEWYALGCGGFSAGWHCWQVFVQEAGNAPVCGRACWALGVARESVRRKGSLQLSPQEGIWAVGKNSAGETVAFSKVHEKLSLRRPLRRLRVRLNYETEEVEFLDVEIEAPLYAFQRGPFLGERVYLFFYLGQEGVTLQCEECPGSSVWDSLGM